MKVVCASSNPLYHLRKNWLKNRKFEPVLAMIFERKRLFSFHKCAHCKIWYFLSSLFMNLNGWHAWIENMLKFMAKKKSLSGRKINEIAHYSIASRARTCTHNPICHKYRDPVETNSGWSLFFETFSGLSKLLIHVEKLLYKRA